MTKSLNGAVVALLCVCLSAAVVAGASQHPAIAAAGGELTAVSADGSVIWKVCLEDSAVPAWPHGVDGTIVLDNGVAIDQFGRVCARRHDLGE